MKRASEDDVSTRKTRGQTKKEKEKEREEREAVSRGAIDSVFTFPSPRFMGLSLPGSVDINLFSLYGTFINTYVILLR